MEEKLTPLFLVNGFLDSGKTQFLKFTMEQEYFQTEGKTLLIVCEYGEEEYEKSFLEKYNTVLFEAQKIKDISSENLAKLNEEYKPERILLEWNGVWNQDDFKLPKELYLNQMITIFDTSTMDLYLKNMKPLMGSMLRKSELVICNRADDIDMDILAKYHLAIRAMASDAEIVFEGKEGEIRGDFSIELPYDINADSITIENQYFGIFYIDSMDRTEKYDNKEVEYVGQVLKPKAIPKNSMVIGRTVMTCCEADMRFLGLICKSEQVDAFKNKDWVKVRGTLKNEFVDVYGGEGAVIYVKDIVRTSPVNEIISF